MQKSSTLDRYENEVTVTVSNQTKPWESSEHHCIASQSMVIMVQVTLEECNIRLALEATPVGSALPDADARDGGRSDTAGSIINPSQRRQRSGSQA
jgi:hypothetical protein